MSLSLFRRNAKIVKTFVCCILRDLGQHFWKGDDVPALDV
jgi:hypothetical protein